MLQITDMGQIRLVYMWIKHVDIYPVHADDYDLLNNLEGQDLVYNIEEDDLYL